MRAVCNWFGLFVGIILVSFPAQGRGDTPDGASVRLGGALRFNAFYKSWEKANGSGPSAYDLRFDVLRLRVDAKAGPFFARAEYEFYEGYSLLHRGYLQWTSGDTWDVRLGINKVPFGLLPGACHNWFFVLPYYVGLEYDFDRGVKLRWKWDGLVAHVAFYLGGEGHYVGDSRASARYSYDIVPVNVSKVPPGQQAHGARRNEEASQGNVRLAYTLRHSATAATELGASVEFGGVRNKDTGRMGHRWAVAVHVDGRYGPLHVQLQALRYEIDLANPPLQDRQFVMMGAYDAPYQVASHADSVVLGVAYDLGPIGPLDGIQLYNDYSTLIKRQTSSPTGHQNVPGFQKRQTSYPTSHQNVIGFLVTKGPIRAYVDVAIGKNSPWLSPSYATSLSTGDGSDKWHVRFNINLGYYFETSWWGGGDKS